MISDIFFNVKELKEDAQYYSDAYLFYYISSYIINNGALSKNEIYKLILDRYHINNINNKKFDDFLNRFNKSNFLYFLDIIKINYWNEAYEFNQNIIKYLNESEENLFKLINNCFDNKKINIIELINIFFSLDKKKNDSDLIIYEANIYNILLNGDLIKIKLLDVTAKIDVSYYNLPIDLIINDKLVLDILFINGISTVKDLIQLPVETLIIIFSKNIDDYLNLFKTMNDAFNVNLKSKFSKLFKVVKTEHLNIIRSRFGFDGAILTLEEVGNIYGVTRERIRQIQNYCLEKIKSYFFQYESIIVRIYFCLINNNKYLSKDEIVDYVKDKDIALFILIMMEHPRSIIKYDDNLGAIYNSKLFCIEDLEQEVINNFGNTISKYEFNEANSFEKMVIKKNYRETKTGIYIRTNVNSGCLITELIDELFPNGYHISSKDEYELLVNKFKERYGEENDISSPRAVTGILERYNYCQIDRGTYKKNDYCIKLSEEYVNTILDYILQNEPVVFYQSIYEHFKNELNEQGVNNYYYLKGLIDPKLPKEFITRRNYISIGEVVSTSKESIFNHLKSFDKIFTYKDIKVKFEGINDYVIYNCLYSEFNKGLLRLNGNKFIYFDKLSINNSVIEELLSFVDSIFLLFNTKVLNVKKIYESLYFDNQNLLKKLKYIDCSFSLFSLLKYIGKDKYYFGRPIISLEKSSSLGQEKLTMSYVSKLNYFNFNLIKKYQEDMKFRTIDSYLGFMESMSEDFVQIEIDSMIRKDKFEMDNKFLINFEEKLNLLFTKLDLIDTRVFNSYMIFPKLKYNWNKYLLAGIIRTYFSDSYIVKNTSYQYKITDFIVKKIV